MIYGDARRKRLPFLTVVVSEPLEKSTSIIMVGNQSRRTSEQQRWEWPFDQREKQWNPGHGESDI